MPKLLKVQVSVEHGHALAQVAEQLAAHGFKLHEIFGEIDVIVGTAPPAALARLRQVKGVTDVATQTQIDIGPPGADSTW